MATILIVDDDLGLQKILGLSLQKYNDIFEILFAGNGEEAIKILEHETIDLLVTDIKMPKMDGLSLLSHMSVNYPSIPCIVLTSYTIPGLEEKLSRSVFRFLKKPIEPTRLAKLVMKGLNETGRDGTLSGVSVPGLMQIIEAEEKTCLLVINVDGQRQGAMYFHKGVLFDAVSGNLKGEKAAMSLIALDNAQLDYRKSPSKKVPQRIQSGMQALILEAMRIKDETEAEETAPEKKSSKQLDKLLAEGIRLAEGLHFQKAQKYLIKVASLDADSFEAWLWLSRTVNNMKPLRIALKNAYKLNPKNREVIHEIRGFNIAEKMALKQIRHCPFCYAPMAVKAAECHLCKAKLVVNDEVLPTISEKVDRKEMRLALTRFEDVLARELNIPVLFYAALACLHLEDYDVALEYLEQLQHCVDPEEIMYTTTVEKIVEFIASRKTTDTLAERSEHELHSPVTPEVSQQKKILVVEDSPTTRKVIKMTLQRNDFLVIEAEDGVEALTKINDEKPDLILLDVMLPKLDGYGILSVLKQNSAMKEVPVIMLTSKDGLKDKIKGKFSSASAYLTKPFKPDMLIEKVNRFIR